MGKDLNGKELGPHLTQTQDHKYHARFTSKRKANYRPERTFNTLPEARRWLKQAMYDDLCGESLTDNSSVVPTVMTVDNWFDFWIVNIVGDLADNTRRNYRERYTRNIQPVMGKMKITDVKPMHCKMVLNQMDDKYAGSTIRQAYITMGTFFKAALENDIIAKHPLDGVKFTKPVKAKDDIQFLTRDEQRKFLEVARNSHNINQYELILETGLRTGELIGLTWNEVDFEKRTLTVNKTMEFRYGQQFWRAGPPKSLKSYRTIPLTDRAYDILKKLWDERGTRKESPELSETIEYMDSRSGTTSTFVMRDLVFINFRTGLPAKNSSYDTHLYEICKGAKLPQISMHDLRHTYATRAIESGMQPKVLQKFLGHSSLKVTMDTYVHVTDDSMDDAIKLFEQNRV